MEFIGRESKEGICRRAYICSINQAGIEGTKRHNPARNSSAIITPRSPHTSLVSGTGPLESDWLTSSASKNLNCHVLLFLGMRLKQRTQYPEIETSIMEANDSIFV